MITLGPPLESREPTRLRSAMSKNLQEFAYRCCSLCAVSLPGGSAISALPPILAFFFLSPLLVPSFSYVLRVHVCVCVFTAPASYASLPAISRRRIFDGASSCTVLRRVLFSWWISCLTRARPVVSLGRPIFCLFTCR